MSTQEELLNRIHDLEQEVKRLNSQIKRQKYGLTWLDVPEAFEAESENKIPILEEVPELAIHNDDDEPTHILIEGDNYHALTCLNYTHKGKVDVIYIDPPYNTGNDGFTYMDKRFLTEYPNGGTLGKGHPLRHSAWLSFMDKRLRLAKNLLSDKGVIFISIDDNEQANLKLLCDKVFGEQNFVAKFDWRKKTGANDAKDIAVITETVLLYAKNKVLVAGAELWNRDIDSRNLKRFKYEDEFVNVRGKYYLDTLDRGGLQYSDSLNYGILAPDGGIIYPNGRSQYFNDGWIWKWGKEKVQWGIENKFIEFVESKKSASSKYTIKYKVYENVDNEGNPKHKVGRAYSNLIMDPINQQGSSDLSDIFGGKNPFSNPKPVGLIKYLLNTLSKKNIIVLDFFAGSGTTLHAIMELNEKNDEDYRQCILINNNENNICREITYERNKRVMNGYTGAKGNKVEGLGNSLKYYRTTFVGKHQPADASDEDRIILSQKAGCLLAMAENTLEEKMKNNYYQIYTNGKGRFTAIYFQEDYRCYDEFLHKVESLLGHVVAYVFSFGTAEEFRLDFEMMRDVELKAIPQPILDIYKSLNK